MRLVDKDKLLEELTEGQEAGLGLRYSRYGNINSIDDAIEAVKYADEVDLSKIQTDERTKTIDEFAQNLKLKTHMENRLIDILAEQMKEKSNINRQADEIDLSELKPENAVSINGNNGGDVVEIKDLNDGTSSVFIATSCVPIIQGIYKNEMLPQLIFDVFIERDIDKALKNVESFKISNDKTVLNSDGLSQPIPTIEEEEIPFKKTNLVKEVHDWPVDNKDPSKGHNYWFVNDANSKIHILVNNSFIDISFSAGALYKNYTFYASSYCLNNKEALTRIAENIFSADQNMTLQDWLNDYKTVFARAISDELKEEKEYAYGVQINNSFGFICVCFKSINKLEDFLRYRANNIFANKAVSLFTNTDKSEKITFRCGGEEYIVEKGDIDYINETYHNSYDKCYREDCVEIDKEDDEEEEDGFDPGDDD